MTYDAHDLKDDIGPGRDFYVSPYIMSDITVEETDVPVEVAPNPPVRNRLGGDSWAFEAANSSERWIIVVDPDDGGPNGGVAYLFWYHDGDPAGGHHEVYPRAFQFTDE